MYEGLLHTVLRVRIRYLMCLLYLREVSSELQAHRVLVDGIRRPSRVNEFAAVQSLRCPLWWCQLTRLSSKLSKRREEAAKSNKVNDRVTALSYDDNRRNEA